MRTGPLRFVTGLLMLALPLAGLAAGAPLSPQDQAAAFRAAGFKPKGKHWVSSCGEGSLQQVQDFNGDGQPEALIADESTECYGMTGAGYHLVSRQPGGSWRLVAHGPGIVTVLKAQGAGHWPDLEIGGPGTCFPVLRWNGRAYALHRHENQGRRCKPPV